MKNDRDEEQVSGCQGLGRAGWGRLVILQNEGDLCDDEIIMYLDCSGDYTHLQL